MNTFVTILLLLLLIAALTVGGYFAYKKWGPQKGGKYVEVQDSTAKKSGKCSGTDGTVTADIKTSSDCKKACDTATPTACNGYDWDTKTCTLYASAPTAAAYTSGGTDTCYALAK